MSRRKEFNQWTESVINDLNLRVDTNYEYENLKPYHWDKLWRIFEEYIEKPQGGAKEQQIAYDESSTLAEGVIADAYGETLEELEIQAEVFRLVSKDDQPFQG